MTSPFAVIWLHMELPDDWDPIARVVANVSGSNQLIWRASRTSTWILSYTKLKKPSSLRDGSTERMSLTLFKRTHCSPQVRVGVVQSIQLEAVHVLPLNTMFDDHSLVLTLWPRRNLLKKAFRVGVRLDGQAQ
jgi:hypothetical protein